MDDQVESAHPSTRRRGRLEDANRERAAEERFRRLLAAAPDGIVVIDGAGRILLANDQAERLFTYGPGELVGLSVEDLLPNELRSRHAAHRATYLANPRTRPMGAELDLVGRRMDGATFPAEISLSPLETDEGLVVTAVVRDVSDRRRIEAALRESEERFRSAFESSAFGMALVAPDGRFLRVNRSLCELVGYAEEELLTKTFQAITHRDDLDADLEQAAKLWAGEARSYQLKKRYVRKDGRIVWALLTRSAVHGDDGGVRYGIAQIEDVTVRERVEQEIRLLNADLERRVAERTAELLAINQELEAFAYSVSHDLRAPVRGIVGFVRILLDEHAADLSADARDALEEVHGNAVRMGQMVDGLLAFSRLGRQPLVKRSVRPVDLVAEALADLAVERAGRQVEITVGDLPPCLADPTLLRQVFANLLANALKFTRGRDPAVVEIGWRPDPGLPGGGAYIVRDNGTGFDPRYIDKLFRVFSRLHRAEEYEGTGIGLALVQRIVHRHGGQIWATGEPDRGATFAFALP